VNPEEPSGVYDPMEAQQTQLAPVRIDGRQVGLDPDDGLQIIGESFEVDEGPPPSAAYTPDGGEAFAEFYRSDYANIARALGYTLGNVDLGREATDEAMARAYARWDKIRDYDSPAGWVYRVGLNWAYSVRRRMLRSLPFHEHVTSTEPPISDPAIAQALRKLDVKLRAVVVCRLLLDWSVEETADALHIRPGTVKSRLHRALANLERSLGHMRS
jgi:RNA polymerase sigma-70 factor (ECF subfamily)